MTALFLISIYTDTHLTDQNNISVTWNSFAVSINKLVIAFARIRIVITDTLFGKFNHIAIFYHRMNCRNEHRSYSILDSFFVHLCTKNCHSFKYVLKSHLVLTIKQTIIMINSVTIATIVIKSIGSTIARTLLDPLSKEKTPGRQYYEYVSIIILATSIIYLLRSPSTVSTFVPVVAETVKLQYLDGIVSTKKALNFINTRLPLSLVPIICLWFSQFAPKITIALHEIRMSSFRFRKVQLILVDCESSWTSTKLFW